MTGQVIKIQALGRYELSILNLERELYRLQEAYQFGPHEPKGPMDWERVVLEDGTDARYCPQHDSTGPTVAQLYDYENKLIDELERLRLELAKAALDEIYLITGVDNSIP